MNIKTFEFKFDQASSESDDYYYIEGLASTSQKDWAGDVVDQSALAGSVAKYGMPKFCLQHASRSGMPLGVIEKMEVTEHGTMLKAKMPKKVKQSQEAYELAKMGAFGGFSIGFIPTKESTEKDGTNVIKEMILKEVSLVTMPCNEGCKVTSVKQFLDSSETLKDIEGVLKENGFSNTEAKQLISKVAELKHRDDAAKQREAEEQVKQDITRELTEYLKALKTVTGK